MQVLFTTMLLFSTIAVLTKAELPTPTTWPEQFHSIIMMNFSGELQLKYLWYDWTNGRNFIITQSQLGKLRYDLELNNGGTSFYYTLDSDGECTSVQSGIGILRPNWLEGGTYIGQRHVDGFLCYVWEKADFITYYEDVVTRRPVLWVFHTGRELHVMTFEVGEALEEKELQVPRYCYEKTTRVTTMAEVDGSIVHHQEYGGLANIAMYLGNM